MQLLLGDNLVLLKGLADSSIDAVVTDPPYGLKFMGKKWDYDLPPMETWQQVLRVLKPGGHLLSFGGTRTYHRLVCAIEDAGFEIRDQLLWLYGQGFPKALDCAKQAIKEGVACGCEKIPEHNVRPLSEKDISAQVDAQNQQSEILQHCLPEQGVSEQGPQRDSIIRGEESLLAGGLVHRAEQGLPHDTNAKASESTPERIRIGTHTDSRTDSREAIKSERSGSSHKSRQSGQPPGEFKNLQQSQGTLDGPSLSRCSRCERPIFPEGFKTTLKPANEPIVLARKPFSEKTVVANMLKWGTGGINVDSCRIGSQNTKSKFASNGNSKKTMGEFKEWDGTYKTEVQGRFPSNLLLDESAAEMLDEQSGSSISRGNRRGEITASKARSWKNTSKQGIARIDFNDTGGASRFFYVAKTSKRERGEGNVHPTVKPIKLMSYLCRLITPPKGIILDPFMGSGSTGIAALQEGFDFVGMELNEEYFEIAKKRIQSLKEK